MGGGVEITCTPVQTSLVLCSVVLRCVSPAGRGSRAKRLIGGELQAAQGVAFESAEQRSLAQSPAAAQCLVLLSISEMSGWQCPAATPKTPSSGSDWRPSNVT